MREKLVGLGVLFLVGGALGCFESVSELSEAEAVAEALTRGMKFNGGEVVDGDLPGGLGEGVLILPPGLPTVMAPGDSSVMLFDLDAPEEAEDPAEATLFKFQGSRKHIRVTGGGKGKVGGTGWHFEHPFAMDENLCDGLCNKKHAVKLRMAMKMHGGRTSAEKELSLTLDCREYGDSDACESDNGGNIAIPGADYLAACQNAAGVCGSFAGDIGISAEVAECVGLYECVQVFYTGDRHCQGLVQDLVGCMGKADDARTCDECASISDDLMNECPFPELCLNFPSDPFDASVGPEPVADASMPAPGIDFMLTDSLVDNCAMMCDLSQRMGCTTFSDTCRQDCEGGFAGTVCEPALVEFQRCAWKTTSDQTFTCENMSMPVDPTATCPGEAQMITDCLIDNPGIGGDASVPAGVDAGPEAGTPGPDGGV